MTPLEDQRIQNDVSSEPEIEVEFIDFDEFPCSCAGAPPYGMTECGAQDAWLKERERR